ncbi:hypothetical protein D3C86_1281530 [compost metagenome]
MHARTVVAHHRLRHERRRLAVGVRHVLDHVLLELGPVGALYQRAETRADFVLALASHFVVVDFNGNAERFEDQAHFRTDVLEGVDRGNREVAALLARTVTAVAVLEFLARRPRGFLGMDLHRATLHVDVPGHAVENEEFRFRTEEGGVAQAGALQVGFGALRDGTRIAVVTLAVRRLDHVAGQHQRRFFVERVDVGRVRIRHQQHVRSFDTLPAGDRRTVEGVTAFELVFIEVRHGHGHVLLLAFGIGETEIDELDVVFLHELHHICNAVGHAYLLEIRAESGKAIVGSGPGKPSREPPQKGRGMLAESMPTDALICPRHPEKCAVIGHAAPWRGSRIAYNSTGPCRRG